MMPTGTIVTSNNCDGRTAHATHTIRWSARQNCQSFVDSSPDGELEGSVELPDSSLIVGSNGRIRANLLARSIVVEGRVDGNLYGAERAELKKSAAVVGDI